MIRLSPNAFYYVQPPWSRFSWRWEDLPTIFSNPISAKMLPDDDRLRRMGYESGAEKFSLIDGPVGNGIIKGFGSITTSRYLWMAVLFKEAAFSRFPGFPPSVADYNACWLEELRTADHKMGLKELFPTFVPSISLDYDELPDASIYTSLAFRKGRVDEEVVLRFQMRCQVFGWRCEPLESALLTGTATKLTSPTIQHHWFSVATGNDDLGLLVSKMFYLACAAKQEANRDFRSIHLVGAFEGEPAMAQRWRGPDGKLKFGDSL